MSATAKKSTNNAQVIYDMPEEEYHALERLSSSGIKKILVSAQDFWKTSWMNEDREERKTDALNLGTAYHKYILEGKASFFERYAPEFDDADHPDALGGMNDMKEILEALGLKAKRSKRDTFELVREHRPDATLLDDIKEDHERKYEGKEFVKQRVIDQIEAADKRIKSTPDLAKYFKDGKAEVTLLWDDPETNVPMKSRIDYLGEGYFTDLKTFSNPHDSDIKHIITSHIARYKYYIQAAVYREAVEQAAGLIDIPMYFFFQQTGDVNNSIPVGFRSDLLLAGQGRDLMRKGIDKFAELYRKYGTKEWIEEFDYTDIVDEDFPLFAYD